MPGGDDKLRYVTLLAWMLLLQIPMAKLAVLTPPRLNGAP